MGRQVVFHLHPDDAGGFEGFLRSSTNLAVLAQPQPTLEVVEAASLFAIADEPRFERLLVRRSDLVLVRTTHVPAQGYYLVDKLRSPVIEFTPGINTVSTEAGRGRLWHPTSYFDESGRRIEMPSEFLAWAGKVLSWVRRHWSRTPDGDYLSPSATAP